jgi:hypothetical protein
MFITFQLILIAMRYDGNRNQVHDAFFQEIQDHNLVV